MKKLLIIVFTLIMTLLAFGKDSIVTKKYSTRNIKEFSFKTNRGDIVIDSKDIDFIEISYDKNIPNLKLTEDIDNDSIELGLKKNSLFKSKDKTKYKISISIPKKYLGEIELTTVNGNISISNIGSEVELSSVNGNITASNLDNIDKIENVNGNISTSTTNKIKDVKSVNGNISILDTNFIEDVETTNGNIKVISKNFSHDGEISSVNGSINITLDNFQGDNEISNSRGIINLVTTKNQINLVNFKKNTMKDTAKDIAIKGKNINIQYK